MTVDKAPGSDRGARVIHVSAVVGARPNFVKMAPILEEARRRPVFACRLIHTGQHYSPDG